GNNECKYLGGCEETVGQNKCKGKGACAIKPLKEDSWKKARASFEEARKNAEPKFGDAPEKKS
ncbi:MAG: hypothetical protein IID45_01595, partial [Planctomycetes bacterium]|nr:hypothetical protein [Planctomycetota bacterium]